MKTKILTNPWSMEMLRLIQKGMTAKDLELVAGKRTVVLPALMNAGYLFKDDNDHYSVTIRGYEAMEIQSKKDHTAKSKSSRPLVDLVVKPHFRQADIQAIRLIPSMFNGVTYYAK